MPSQLEQQQENLVHALAGAGGGMISMALTYPLITVGTRLQVQKGRAPSPLKGSKAYTGVDRDSFAATVQRILDKEGVEGLYAGLPSALFGIALTNGVYYYWYEYVKSLLDLWNRRGRNSFAATVTGASPAMGPFQSLLAGAVAGAATVLLTNPVWMINTRLAAGKKSMDDDDSNDGESSAFSNSNSTLGDSPTASSPAMQRTKKQREGAWQMLKTIIREDGVASLWQGVMPALILVSNPSIQYMIFEQLKSRVELQRKMKGLALNNLDFFLLGALSKLVATFVTYPYIVIKARMQLRQSPKKPTSSATPSPYASTISAFQTILREEGPAGLYKGLSSKLLQSVLTAAILFWAKEGLVDVTRKLVETIFLQRRIGATK